jgi:hypothetical protein
VFASAAVLLLCAACSAGRTCEQTPPEASGCADLTFDGVSYDEWRPFRGTGILQELGDGSYPACNAAAGCGENDVDGFGATDVWRLEGVDPRRALIGLREDTHTKVVFVRVGLDPDRLRPAAG